VEALKCAGIRVEPPISEPKSKAVSPAAVATAPPPAEPPDVRAVFHGLSVGPNTGLSAWTSWFPAGMLVLPMISAPAVRSRRTTSAPWSGT
jgi:hypothetical protein